MARRPPLPNRRRHAERQRLARSRAGLLAAERLRRSSVSAAWLTKTMPLPTGSMLSAGFEFAQLDVGYRDHWFSPFTDSAMLISTRGARRCLRSRFRTTRR